jgi:Zyg-11 protein homolog
MNQSQPNIDINSLVSSINCSSCDNLKSVDLSRNWYLFSTILVDFQPFKSLKCLNVSFTSFNNHSLQILCETVIGLESLDISGTRVNDLLPLLSIQLTIKHLFMYNMRASIDDKDILPIIDKLVNLEHLDVSTETPKGKYFDSVTWSNFDVNLLLDKLTCNKLNHFKSIDISGKKRIEPKSLK